jgi:hypothetical protein
VPGRPSIRRLSLIALDQAALDELVLPREDLLVERNRDLPKRPASARPLARSPPRSVDGFCWASLTTGTSMVGRSQSGLIFSRTWQRLDCGGRSTSAIRRRYARGDNKPIGVIRVFASADVPHIVRGTGAVYVRSSRGQESVAGPASR